MGAIREIKFSCLIKWQVRPQVGLSLNLIFNLFITFVHNFKLLKENNNAFLKFDH